MDYQIDTIGKATRPAFADLITFYFMHAHTYSILSSVHCKQNKCS